LALIQQQHVIPREEVRFPIVAMAEMHLAKMYPGDKLEIHQVQIPGRDVETYFHHLGTAYDGKADRRVIGRLPHGYRLDDHTTWVASVVGVPAREVRLTPFPKLDCGCVKNLGGYYVSRCEPHQRDFDRECWEADQRRREWEGFGDEYTGDPRVEQERDYQGAC
jgi:hypothetical protein